MATVEPTQPQRPGANPRSRIDRWFRYLVAGGLAALVYMGVTAAAHAWLGMSLGLAGVIGYACSMPCAYLLHRRLSFGSSQLIKRELPKFVLQSIVSALLSGLLPSALGSAGCPLAVALLLTSVAIPIFNYVMLSSWVFRTK